MSLSGVHRVLLNWVRCALCAGVLSGAASGLLPRAAMGEPLPAVDERLLPPLRSNDALVSIPDGWALGTRKLPSTLILVPRNLAKGETVELYVNPASQLQKKQLADIADEDFKICAKTEKDYHTESPRVAGRHPAGYASLTEYTSCVDKGSKIGKAERAFFLSVYLDDTDGGYQPFVLYATTPALIAKYRRDFETFVGTARLLGAISLAKPVGDETLTLGTIFYLSDFIEYLLDVPLTQLQHDAIKQYLIDAWNRNDQEEIKGVKSTFEARDALDAMTDKDKKELARQAARTEILKVGRDEAAKGDKMAKMLVDLYDDAQRQIAPGGPGEPALTRQSSDATLEVLYFMGSRAIDPKRPDGKDARPAKAQMDAWAAQMAAAYAGMPLESKRSVAEMPMIWAALRVAWNQTPRDEKITAATAWANAPMVQKIVAEIRANRKEPDFEILAKAIHDMQMRQEIMAHFNRTMNYKPPKW